MLCSEGYIKKETGNGMFPVSISKKSLNPLIISLIRKQYFSWLSAPISSYRFLNPRNIWESVIIFKNGTGTEICPGSQNMLTPPNNFEQ